jgi:hypothetical protein
MAKPLPAALQQKIAQSQLGTGPSLVPQSPVPKIPEYLEYWRQSYPKEDVEVIHPISELIADPEELETLVNLIQAVVPHSKEIKRLEKIVDPMRDRIKAIIRQYGIEKSTCGEIQVDCYRTVRTSINKVKLLAAGVEQSVIDACTDSTPSYTLKIKDSGGWE